MNKIALVVVVAGVLGCAQRPAVGEDLWCLHHGGMQEKVCPVSAIKLSVESEKYLEKVVAVSGFIRKVDDRFYLFPNKSFSDASNISDAAVLDGHKDEVAKYENKLATVIGGFSSHDEAVPTMFSAFGRIEVRLVRGAGP